MIVYYAERNNLYIEEIIPLSKCCFDDIIQDDFNPYIKCPAFNDSNKNIFVIKYPFDYNLNWNKNESSISSTFYDQNFFNKSLNVRSVKSGLASLMVPRLIFFSEEDLEMEQLPPYLHNVMGVYTVVPGKFNIGKHFRLIETAIQWFKPGVIEFKENDPLYYIKFYTNEKIIFKKFLYTENISHLQRYFHYKRQHTKKVKPLSWYYDNSIRKTILKEIKKNLFVD